MADDVFGIPSEIVQPGIEAGIGTIASAVVGVGLWRRVAKLQGRPRSQSAPIGEVDFEPKGKEMDRSCNMEIKASGCVIFVRLRRSLGRRIIVSFPVGPERAELAVVAGLTVSALDDGMVESRSAAVVLVETEERDVAIGRGNFDVSADGGEGVVRQRRNVAGGVDCLSCSICWGVVLHFDVDSKLDPGPGCSPRGVTGPGRCGGGKGLPPMRGASEDERCCGNGGSRL
jgi:hypothetical protein